MNERYKGDRKDKETDVSKCKYLGSCIEGCTHSSKNCALYHALEDYNRAYNLDIDPLTFIILKLHNHGFSGLQELVVLEAMGLRQKLDKSEMVKK